MQIIKTSLLMVLAFVSLAAQQSAPDQPKEQPVIFGAPVISTGFDEKSIAMAPDGKSVYFTRGVKYAKLSVILVSHLRNGSWSTPQVADFSGRYRDKDPCFSPDNQKLYFSSDRPVPGTQRKGFDIWVVERKGQRWSEPVNLGSPVNTGEDEESPSLTADGTLYFTSDRKGTLGDLDIYRARRNGQGFSEPENLGAGINTERPELAVCIEPHERFLIFASQRPGFGNSDLFITHSENGQWSPVKNLGSGINTAAEEHSPSLSPDGQLLFFSSARGMGQKRVLERRVNYQELIDKLRSPGNDSLDIYQIGISRVTATR